MSEDYKYHRQSIRLPGYDYSQNGLYFVTLNVHDREHVFGEIQNQHMVLNEYGKIVQSNWLSLPAHHRVVLHECQIMPNHMHFILQLDGDVMGGSRPAPTLGLIIGFLKSESTKTINRVRATPGSPLWQRNYYEHIIRNENEYYAIKQYIMDNVINWESDILR